MMASRAVLIGVSGLGVEIAKNIILAGISSVTLCDPEVPNSFDLGGNFYLAESDLNKCDEGEDSKIVKDIFKMFLYKNIKSVKELKI